MLDVVIIGGGPAGLSAALMLSRCLRRTLVVDEGRPRNRFTRHVHGFLTRDGIPPAEFRERAHRDLARYGTSVIPGVVTKVQRSSETVFRVNIEPHNNQAHTVETRTILIATGVRDDLPCIAGFDTFYGVTVHHCPYCDAYEHRGKRLAAYGPGDHALGLALSLRTWSESVTACTDGVPCSQAKLETAARAGIRVCEARVAGLRGNESVLEWIDFNSGDPLRADALFFNTGQVQRSNIAATLGCRFKDDGGVCTDDRQCTTVPGVYLAGDAHHEVQFVISAAAEGATAAVAVNAHLQKLDGRW